VAHKDRTTGRSGIRRRRDFKVREIAGERKRDAISSRKNTKGCAKFCFWAIAESKGSCNIERVGRTVGGHRESAVRVESK